MTISTSKNPVTGRTTTTFTKSGRRITATGWPTAGSIPLRIVRSAEGKMRLMAPNR